MKKRVATCLYVIGQETGAAPVKIGVACDPAARLAQLQCGSPVMLKLFHVHRVAGDAAHLEGFVHFSLERSRRHGEWFDLLPDEAIEKIREIEGRMCRVMRDE